MKIKTILFVIFVNFSFCIADSLVFLNKIEQSQRQNKITQSQRHIPKNIKRLYISTPNSKIENYQSKHHYCNYFSRGGTKSQNGLIHERQFKHSVYERIQSPKMESESKKDHSNTNNNRKILDNYFMHAHLITFYPNDEDIIFANKKEDLPLHAQEKSFLVGLFHKEMINVNKNDFLIRSNIFNTSSGQPIYDLGKVAYNNRTHYNNLYNSSYNNIEQISRSPQINRIKFKAKTKHNKTNFVTNYNDNPFNDFGHFNIDFIKLVKCSIVE